MLERAKRNLDAAIDTVYELGTSSFNKPNRADLNAGTRPEILSLNSESLFTIYSKEIASNP